MRNCLEFVQHQEYYHTFREHKFTATDDNTLNLYRLTFLFAHIDRLLRKQYTPCRMIRQSIEKLVVQYFPVEHELRKEFSVVKQQLSYWEQYGNPSSHTTKLILIGFGTL